MSNPNTECESGAITPNDKICMKCGAMIYGGPYINQEAPGRHGYNDPKTDIKDCRNDLFYRLIDATNPRYLPQHKWIDKYKPIYDHIKATPTCIRCRGNVGLRPPREVREFLVLFEYEVADASANKHKI